MFYDALQVPFLEKNLHFCSDRKLHQKIKHLQERIYDSVVKWTTILGYHNPDSNRLKDKFTVHNLRHVFTDFLRQAGMPREYIQELRGDSKNETIDIYTHISKRELRKSYNSYIPKLDVY